MEGNELLWNLYMSERGFIKHHENQRTTASNILTAIAAGLIVALGTGNLSVEIQMLISYLLSVIGFFGYVFCTKLYALIKLHASRSYEYLKILDSNFKEINVLEIKDLVQTKNKDNFKYFGKLGLNTIWRIFHLFICCTGLISLSFYLIKSFF